MSLQYIRQQPFFKPGFSTPLGRHSPLNRFSNQRKTSYTVSIGKHCSISVTRQSAGPLALFFLHHFPTNTENPVHCDPYTPAQECDQAVTTTSLVSDPHFSQWALTLSLAGSATDPEFRDHWPMNHFTSRQGRSTHIELSVGFTGSFP